MRRLAPARKCQRYREVVERRCEVLGLRKISRVMEFGRVRFVFLLTALKSVKANLRSALTELKSVKGDL